MSYKDTIIEDQLQTIRRLNQEYKEKSDLMFEAINRLELTNDPKQFYFTLCGILRDEVMNCPKEDYNEPEHLIKRETISDIIDSYCKFYGIEENE